MVLVSIKVTGYPEFLTLPDTDILTKPWNSSLPGYKGARRKYLPIEHRPARLLTKHDLLIVQRNKSIRRLPSVLSLRGGSRSKQVALPMGVDTFKAIGLYLAEGSVKSDGRTVQFVFGHHEVALAKSTAKWAETIGVSSTESRGIGTRIVMLFSKALAMWFYSEFGSGSWIKHLPSWVVRAPFKLQAEMLRHHFLGDGSRPDPTHPGLVFNTRSEVLARQEQLLFLRLGVQASLHSCKDHGDPMWHVNISGAAGRELGERWNIPVPAFTKATYNRILIDEKFAYFPVRHARLVKAAGHIRSDDFATNCFKSIEVTP